jgi:predicted ATP-binding protein involved in virulence
MKITKVILQNFRGIGSLELDFPIEQNVITLVGINGVGKSSILDTITIILSTCWLISYRCKHGISSEKNYPNQVKNSDIKINQEAASCKIVFSDSDNNCKISIFKTYDSYKASDYIPALSEIAETLLIRHSSDRQVGLISSRSYRMDFVGNNISEKGKPSDFDIFFKWFKDLEDIEHEEMIEENSQHRNKSLEAVRKAISHILGEGFSRLRVRRATNDLIVNKNGIDISIRLLSDGEKSLIALVSDLAKNLATTYPNMENPLEGDGIVLIDEIELHMHPTWQRMIIPRLTKTFPNCQFIITTHSPQVLSHVQPESIYLLKKVGEDIVVSKPQYSYGRDSNRILEDLMDETERPAEIQDQLGELFSLIHQGHLSEAQQLVEQLSETIGASEPELGKAEVMIKRREIIGR